MRLFSYKCGNIINKNKVIIGRLKEMEEIGITKEETELLRQEFDAMKQYYKEDGFKNKKN